MKKKIIIPMLAVVLISVFIIPSATGLGLAPCEMRVIDAQGSGVVGTIVLVNSDSDPRWIKLQVMSPSDILSEKKHMRVICDDCSDSHQRYEVIQDYVPSKNEKNLVGVCPRCLSTNLTFFETPPKIILKNIILVGKDCSLIDEGNDVYRISEKLDYRDERHVDIMFSVPDGSEYSGKHYEIHVLATSHPNLESAFGIIPGIAMRLLIDISPTTTSSGFSVPFEIMILVFSGISVTVVSTVLVKKSRKKKKPITMSNSTPTVLKTPMKQNEHLHKNKSHDDIEKIIDKIQSN